MITGELRNKIDSLWETFWTGGITNPLSVIEQITYLMFVRDLDEVDNRRGKESLVLGLSYSSIFAGGNEQCKWSVFRDMAAPQMYEVVQNRVFPFIKGLHADKDSAYSRYMGDALFLIPTPQMLSKVVEQMDRIDWKDKDIRGDVYEYLLSKLSTSGTNGQFRTPRHIIRMMVELLDPKPQDTVCDPACGTSGFLVGAAEYVAGRYFDETFRNAENRRHYNSEMFTGYDMDRTMLRIGAMNMLSHGIENPRIEYKDSLSEQNTDTNKYSVILANPPFKGSLDADIVSPDLTKLVKTKKTELLFLALFLRSLRLGGRCACIVPDGVLFGSSKAHKAIRKAIIEDNCLQAVISMPSGVFKPYAGVSTAILVFTKTGNDGTGDVWFYDMQADGFSLDDKRQEVSENDIPDIVKRYADWRENGSESGEASRARTEKSFVVPKEEIVENDYDLSINKYKEIVYEKVDYPPTSEIMADLIASEAEIQKGLLELQAMLEEGLPGEDG
ncbi:DNA methyltransferase [Collinsella sp. An271]|uniref:type I restriction-modification system subunit M n=1 Tax=Collinsella sp. An271 TaxID=1965616 RepID=UPI000B38B9F7|nr:class I SAM-dependent DNA methyltransferase [Collinsella sp. An271]OUO60579.1 DNA methyltransferase [Collinsella sp. An271]